MHKKYTVLRILVGIVVAVMVLAACSGQPATPAEQPTEAPAQQPTEAPAEEPTEAPAEEPTEAPAEEPTVAQAEGEPVMGGTLDIGMGSEPLSFDPPNYKATTDLIVTRLIYDGLVAFDHELNIVPQLATEWEQIDDTTWQFTLREGVKFSDGSDFNAEDVKASLERGAQKPRGEAFIGFIDGVEIVDDYTVNVLLKEPFGPFLQHMATPVAIITSADHLADATDDDLAFDPIGTGPFALEGYEANQSATLVRNDNYWGEAPPLDHVVFHLMPEESSRFAALQAGDVDVIENPPPNQAEMIRNSSDLQLITGPATRDVRLGFQVQDETLSDPTLRKAIAYGIDAQTIVEFVVEGLARYADNGWLPPEVFTPDPPVHIDYDPERAKELLAEAGYPNGEGLTLQLKTPEGRYLRDKEIAEAIQQQLGEIGINVELEVMEWAAYLDALDRYDSQMFILGWGVSTGDPAVVARQNLHSESTFNWHNYKNPEMDQILEEAETTTDQERRRELYQQMTEMIITEDTIMKPIYWKLNLYAAQSTVHEFRPHPLELIDLSTTWIEQ